MRRTTLNILFSIVLVLMLSSDSNADYNIYRVGDLIIGRDYNKIWSQWSERKFGIWIGIDEENREYIFLHADTGIGPATVRINNEKQEKEKFIGFIMKSIKWSKIAQENQADITKGLGCIGYDPSGECDKYKEATEAGQMSLTFFAHNRGKQTDLILRLIDWNDKSKEATIYLDSTGMKKLLALVGMIDESFVEARETVKKRELFK